MASGDIALTVDANNVLYPHKLDPASGAAESSPDVVAPDTNAGTKRWILSSIFAKLVNSLTLTAQTIGFTISGGTSSKTLTVDETISTSNIYTKNFQMTNTGQPAFLVRPTSHQENIAVGEVVAIVFGTEVFDQMSNFESNTFTAPVAGKYQLNAHIVTATIDSASSYYEMDVVTSNRTYPIILDTTKFSGDLGYYCFSISVLADMDASDKAYCRIYQATGTQQTDIRTDSYFSGHLIC